MKVLLVYPTYPDTFWSFRHALRFIGKRACFPPLGLLTVAAMLPAQWEKKLVDMNVRPLTESDLQWADYVFLSAMTIQQDSVREVLERCRKAGVPTVAGGPLFTSAPGDFPDVDHLILNEAEITLPPFLEDLAQGRPKRLYTTGRRADVHRTPLPLWELVDTGVYASMNVQYSRGCPYDCEFCDITGLFGRRPRTKSVGQMLAELDALHVRGWKGSIFFVDDNFIGEKSKLKKELLPALIRWMDSNRHPFTFYTEASINLADDSELMQLMVRAGFDEVFIGIESPAEESLCETGKVQNRNRDLLASVRTIQEHGLQVQGGFIVGFDSDPPSVFETQIRFIQESGIVTAMVGLLTALRGTRLYHRLNEEGRLLRNATGNNVTTALNFIPRMKMETLIEGYRSILTTIYSPRLYSQRVIGFLKRYRPISRQHLDIRSIRFGALAKSVFILGLLDRGRRHFWKLFLWSLIRRPRQFPLAITFAIYGFHFRKVAESISCTGMLDDDGCPPC